jgi:hypothetical protein
MTTISGFRPWLPLDAQTGPAMRISRARAANIVSTVLGMEAHSRIDVIRPPLRRRSMRKVVFLAAAAFVLPVTVVAGAVRIAAARRPLPAALFAMTPAAHSEPKPQPVAHPAEAVAAPLAEPPAEHEQAAAEGERATEPAHAKTAVPTAARAVAPETSPRDMLQQANDLRAQHQWLAATQMYEKTLHTFPGRAEAYSAMVAAGMLRLDQLGDPKGALSLFASAIKARPHGALCEEARWGTIQSYRALGNGSAETAALQEFVTLHPQSLLAWRALARLRELRGEAP